MRKTKNKLDLKTQISCYTESDTLVFRTSLPVTRESPAGTIGGKLVYLPSYYGEVYSLPTLGYGKKD
ncbi:hypothetical protein IX326_000978 [Porphyromonas levii]|nr:hypothetical protein [Porphyromonas levii]